MLTRGPCLARRWYCLAETNRRPQTRPAQSGERGFLAGLRFASMISLQVSPSLVRFSHRKDRPELEESGLGSEDVGRVSRSALSRYCYAQSPIHAATRLEANIASLFNHFEWWPLIRSRRRCNSLVYRRPITWQDARTQSLSLVTPSGGEST